MSEVNQLRAREVVVEFLNDSQMTQVTLESTFVVSYSQALLNWTALVGITIDDIFLFEVSYNAQAGETVLEAFSKFDSRVFPDPDNAVPDQEG